MFEVQLFDTRNFEKFMTKNFNHNYDTGSAGNLCLPLHNHSVSLKRLFRIGIYILVQYIKCKISMFSYLSPNVITVLMSIRIHLFKYCYVY